MLDYIVEKRIDIATQAESAISFLADYRNWPQWSPWLIMEPECKLNYRGEQGNIGDGYQWDGDLVGAGEMTLMKRSSTCILAFKDHLNLKRWCVFKHTSLKLIGERTQDEIHYVGVRGSGTIAELGPQMQAHFSELNKLVEAKGLEVAGPPFALYHSMKMKQQFFEFTTCFPMRQKVEVTEPYETGTLASCDTYVVEHTGESPFMGNAWSMAMTASRHHKVKVRRRPLGIERYLNDPRDHDAKDLVTEVVLFKK